ncbi:MAG: transcriptional regulator HexR [Gammaproteobacteria bacterium]|nr:transcriptional regulator HexR [Gammaproteobacteria bacterium]
MKGSDSILQRLSGDQIKLSKSDRKLAEIVVKSPDAVIHQSIANLARSAGVSEPTVNRFCHKLGCEGYPDFKLRLAQEISASGQLFVENMAQDDDSAEVIQKVIRSIEAGTQHLSRTVDPSVLDAAAKAICECNSVNFFGMGASSSVALDAQHKFFRFGTPVIAHTDYVNQRMMCSMLDQRDVAVFISYTGRTTAMIENAELAKQHHAITIGITSGKSPLARHCDYVLNVLTEEDTDLFTPMTSRIMHLAVVDMLATVVALRLGPEVESNIQDIKKNLASTRD